MQISFLSNSYSSVDALIEKYINVAKSFNETCGTDFSEDSEVVFDLGHRTVTHIWIHDSKGVRCSIDSRGIALYTWINGKGWTKR